MALYMQQIKHYSPLEITARLLPMIINGILVNVVCGLILHKVSNKLLMLIGATAYMTAYLIMSFTPDDGTYWGWYFVPLMLMVVGADTEFNVVNVRALFLLPPSSSNANGYSNIDVCHVQSSIVRPVSCRRYFQHCV